MAKPSVAVYKFSSCDGCQLSILNLEDELLDLVGVVEIAYFLEARRRTLPGPYDIALVEGSVTTPHEVERIQEIRKQAKSLVTIGACATSGGIQALRNTCQRWMTWQWLYMSIPNTCTPYQPQPPSLSTSRSTTSCGAAR